MRLFESFLADLGIDYIYSGPTTKETVDKGIGCSVSEACLPIQMIHGQVASLVGKVDKILLPRLVNISGKTVFCPKFLGLPDMIRASLGCGKMLVSPRIDLRKGPLRTCLSFVRLARDLGAGGLRAAKLCARDLFATLRDYPGPGVEIARQATVQPSGDVDVPVIGVLGYPYLLEDDYASMGLIRKLLSLNVKVLKADDVSEAQMKSVGETISKQVFWYFSDRKVKSGYHWCRTGAVDGIIHLTAFGCGPDAIAGKLVEIEAKKVRVPYLALSVDECTGEGGVLTRVEAFVDMLTRSPRNRRYGGKYHVESNLPSHGNIGPSSDRVAGGTRQ